MVKIGKFDKADEFEKLYFDNYTNLCQSVYRFVKDEDITKDIVQDVFLTYWQKIHELRINESVVYYLKKSCVNQALNYLKERERRENRENNFSKEVNESSSSNERPDTKYEAKELSNAIQQTIDDLPMACKNAFLLSRHEEKSYKEIATLLNISVNTVEKHIGKALKVLRKALKKR